MQEKKPNYQPVFYTVWQDAWLALTKPRQYLTWVDQPFWRSVKYLMILSAVLAIAGTLYLFLQYRPKVESFRAWAGENLPTITYQDGKLFIEEDQSFSFTDSDSIFIKVDPTVGFADDPLPDAFYDISFLVLNDGILLGDAQQKDLLTYAEIELPNFVLTKENSSELIDKGVTVLLIVLPIIFFLYSVMAKLLYTLVFVAVMHLFTGLQLRFASLWNLAIYALTPAILAGYLGLIFFSVAGLYSLVFVVYFVMAVNYYRAFHLEAPKS